METLEDTKRNPEDLVELRSAIKDYASVLEKFKKTPGLKNYHKYYKKQLNQNFLRVKEKELNKIQQLIPSGIGAEYNFNLYQFLNSQTKKYKINIPVVCTLIIHKKLNQAILLKNNKDGYIIRKKDNQALKTFFHKLKDIKSSGIPLCIYKPDEGKNLLFDSLSNLKSFINETPGIKGFFQEFVGCINKQIHFVRVHWKSNNKLKGYLIGSTKPTHIKISKTTSNINLKTRTIAPDKGKSDEALLEQARKIILDSEAQKKDNRSVHSDNFSNLYDKGFISFDDDYFGLDNQPIQSPAKYTSLKHEIASKCFEPWVETEEVSKFTVPEDAATKFLISARDPKKSVVTELKNIYPDIQSITSDILLFLSASYMKDHKKILEVTLDFMKNGEKWVVVKCEKLLIDENSSNFHEFIISHKKENLLKTFTPILSDSIKNQEKSQLKASNTPSNIFEQPVVNQRSMSTKNSIIPLKIEKITKDPEDSTIAIKQKFENFIDKIDKVAKRKMFDLNESKKPLIDLYEKSFPKYASYIKKQEFIKDQKPPIIDFSLVEKSITNNPPAEKEKIKDNPLKKVIKSYNSIMINVRRISLKNKTPLIDKYGGESFWRRSTKIFCLRIIDNAHIKKYFMHMSKSVLKNMFFNGLKCLFNSEISLDFRRLVRHKHKNLRIDQEDFKMFGVIFINVLAELGVESLDLEIIYDNYKSFFKAVTTKDEN
jgi:hypothetical protein